MKALALALCLAVPALADPLPADAPLAAAPVCYSEADSLLLAKHTARLEAENASLRDSAGIPLWIPVVVGVLALGAGVGVGVAVGRATAPQP